MKLVILESPYAASVNGNSIQENMNFARACLRDSLSKGEAPIASHLLYTQPGVLDDSVPDLRQKGIDAGLAWCKVADYTVVYEDKGISRGMQHGINTMIELGKPVIYRNLAKGTEWSMNDYPKKGPAENMPLDQFLSSF